jgi:SagB-type dehydrogenase family enzyme
VVLAARFDRLMQKYEAMAYGLVLKHVGVIMHAMQLTAEAMGLACCPLGAGQVDAFEALTGADPFAFGPVGELTLGSRIQSEGSD